MTMTGKLAPLEKKRPYTLPKMPTQKEPMAEMMSERPVKAGMQKWLTVQPAHAMAIITRSSLRSSGWPLRNERQKLYPGTQR